MRSETQSSSRARAVSDLDESAGCLANGAICAIFTDVSHKQRFKVIANKRTNSWKPASSKVLSGIALERCTISCQAPVNGVHSIENRCTYKGVISIDEKNRRSKNILVL